MFKFIKKTKSSQQNTGDVDLISTQMLCSARKWKVEGSSGLKTKLDIES